MILEHLSLLDEAPFDVCVIGSGPAGMTVAAELAGGPLRILVVESGARVETDAHRALNAIESVGSPRQMDQRLIRNRVLGGSSHTWSGRCAPLDPIDYEARPWVPLSGWPVAAADLDTCVRRAAPYLGVDPAPYDLGLWGRPGAADLAGTGLTPYAWQYSRDPFAHGDYARFANRAETVAAAENVTILLDATATEVLPTPGGERVAAVELADARGARRIVRAGRVVLAAGGIENARLLLASRRTSPMGLGNRHDTVGRYLMDHPRCAAGTFEPRDARRLFERFGRYLLPEADGGFIQIHGLALSPELQRAHHLLNASAWLGGEVAADDPIAAARRFAKRPSGRDALAILANGGTLLCGLRDAVRGKREVFRKYGRLTLECTVEQMPDAESRVTLSERRDALGVPLARIDWRIGRSERESIAVLADLVARELPRLGLPAPRLADWVTSGRWEDARFIDNAHPIGTTRMAADPREGVVDDNAQVHGVAGLYVAGSSIFPTAGHVNPTCMIVAFAIRLADHLKAVAARQDAPAVADIAA